MIGFIVAVLSTRGGQGAVLALGAAALFFSWLWRHDTKVAAKATTEIVRSLNSDAEKKANEAVKARAPSLRTGAALRLRDATNCRDCE
jgi:hypothetical protein